MRLELRQEDSGPRHYLDGRAVHCGDTLEAFIHGTWQRGRYEATLFGVPTPWLHVDDGMIWDVAEKDCRWPE